MAFHYCLDERRETRDESFSSSFFFGLLAMGFLAKQEAQCTTQFLVRSREMWCIAKEKASG